MQILCRCVHKSCLSLPNTDSFLHSLQCAWVTCTINTLPSCTACQVTITKRACVSFRFIDEVRELVLALSRHHLFAVRYLVAKALVPLVSQKCQINFLRDLLERVPASRSEVNSFNHLHGQLLQLQSVLASSCQRSVKGQ